MQMSNQSIMLLQYKASNLANTGQDEHQIRGNVILETYSRNCGPPGVFRHTYTEFK